MTTMAHRGSLPFVHARERSFSVVAKPETPHDSMFVHNSQNFLTRLRARKHSTHQSTITPAEAVWFLSLPDKVRRQHFTREEQILIRAKSELALLTTAPEALLHAEEAHPPHARGRMHSVACDNISRQQDFRSHRARHASVVDRQSIITGRSKSQDLRPSQVTRLSSESFSIPQYNSQPQSFLRSPTIRDEVIWDAATIREPASPEIGPQSRRPTIVVIPERRPSKVAPVQTQKPLYVKDPSAKLFLRDCVSSGRFEETLNFGFPTNNTFGLGLVAPFQSSDGISPGTTSRANWLDMPEPAEDDSEVSSVDELTTSEPDASSLHPLHKPSVEALAPERQASQSDESSGRSRLNSSTSYFEELMKRDMTLRMTLTKPELRASEDELYGWQEDIREEDDSQPEEDERDPLALADLTFSDDATGLHGAFANMSRKKSIKGLWFRK